MLQYITNCQGREFSKELNAYLTLKWESLGFSWQRKIKVCDSRIYIVTPVKFYWLLLTVHALVRYFPQCCVHTPMTSEESVTLFSQGNSTTKKTCFHSEISFHQGRVFPAPLSLEITVEMMGQLEAVNVPGTPHSASWQPGATSNLYSCVMPVTFLEGSVMYTSGSRHAVQCIFFFFFFFF